MVERVLVSVALAILEHYARRPRARDADDGRDVLRRGAASVRDWLHRNGACAREREPDAPR